MVHSHTSSNDVAQAARDVLELPSATLHYRDLGPTDAPPIVFIHGLMVNGLLWRHVVPKLSANFRCILPDLPLGGHSLPMPQDADMSPLGLAKLIVQVIETLELGPVILVGNDTGGALCQLVAAHYPKHIRALVLTNCDAFESFYPAPLRPLQAAAHIPGFGAFLARILRTTQTKRLLVRLVSKRHYIQAELEAYLNSYVMDPAIQRDTMRWLRGISHQYTLEAATHFPNFHKPTLLVWSEDDWLFSMRNAKRLANAFPQAQLVPIRGAWAFVPEDTPEIFLDALQPFLASLQNEMS
ncbi:MAG: alpha/beta hydrolase [Deinococcota bacterium]